MRSKNLSVPTLYDLQKAYAVLLHRKPACAGIKDIVRFSQWSRFDPRLAEICVFYFSREWKRINPMELRTAALNGGAAAVIAVFFEFTRKIIKKEDPSSFLLFECWRKLVTINMQKAQGELFFIGLRQLGGKAMEEDAIYASDEFRKWGFLSQENLIPKSVGGILSPSTRNELLKAFLLKSNRIRINDYWHLIGKCISRRQAERDLQKSTLLQSKGKTKGKYYIARVIK